MVRASQAAERASCGAPGYRRRGELRASEAAAAGDVLAQSPYALQLRYLSTLINIAGTQLDNRLPCAMDLPANISVNLPPKTGLAFSSLYFWSGGEASHGRFAIASRKRCREWRGATCRPCVQRQSVGVALRRAAGTQGTPPRDMLGLQI